MNPITVIIPYYRAPLMLRKQLDAAALYPPEFRVIVVDDCSPEPAAEIFTPQDKAQLYRISTDIPWNRGGARNLGAAQATTMWVLNVDIDHVLPPESAQSLAEMPLDPRRWYRFPRWRVGAADETRMKDAIPREQRLGKIHPHIDSHLMTRAQFLSSPYDERYSGCLGGGTPFLERMKHLYGEPDLLPEAAALHVHTRDSVPDASVSDLSRDTKEYARRRKSFGLFAAPITPINFEWERVL